MTLAVIMLFMYLYTIVSFIKQTMITQYFHIFEGALGSVLSARDLAMVLISNRELRVHIAHILCLKRKLEVVRSNLFEPDSIDDFIIHPMTFEAHHVHNLRARVEPQNLLFLQTRMFLEHLELIDPQSYVFQSIPPSVVCMQLEFSYMSEDDQRYSSRKAMIEELKYSRTSPLMKIPHWIIIQHSVTGGASRSIYRCAYGTTSRYSMEADIKIMSGL
jgi:hypothetical protein